MEVYESIIVDEWRGSCRDQDQDQPLTSPSGPYQCDREEDSNQDLLEHT